MRIQREMLPLKVEDKSHVVFGNDGFTVAVAQNHEVAQHIAKAVNSFDTLQSKLELMRTVANSNIRTEKVEALMDMIDEALKLMVQP